MFAGKAPRRWPAPVSFIYSVLFCLLHLCNCDELLRLLELKSALRNSSSAVFSSWTRNNGVCNFTGIVCGSDGGVMEIDLSDRNLSGVLPFDSICSLRSLERISFASNFLHGGVSDELRNCTGLRHLDLGQNSFSGGVPDLSGLRGLRSLNLTGNGFSGIFPWKSLQNLTDLVFLSLGDNPFEKSPFPTEILGLKKLYWLYLSNCSIQGPIPAGIGNLSLLENLELSQNQLTGEIPIEILKLKKLWQLELFENSLTGKLPVGFGNLTGLKNFDASTNNLEGDLMELRFLTKLESLQLFENRFSGGIPVEFGDFRDLARLSLYRNELTGSLPRRLGSWTAFDFIDVSENFLSGLIPPDMCKKGSMTKLLIQQNRFSGDIPESYTNCKSLNRLRVNNNSLSGAVPAGIWSLPNLSIIDLSMNQFEGPVASDIGKAKALAQLILSSNRFSGELPGELGEASSLVKIQVDLNQFNGPIPQTIGKLKNLDSLSLNDNNFSDHIPSSLGSCISLATVNLANNSFSGDIPASLGDLPTLNSLNLSNNELSGEIPTSLSLLKLSSLDLSNNKLIGQVPESLSIQAFDDSFKGNPGLCSEFIRYLSSCSSSSSTSSHLGTLILCSIAGILVLLVSVSCIFFVKWRRKDAKSILKSQSWNMKPYHVLSFTEKEIVDAIKSDNLIGKGGSGNVYKVVLSNGKELAVKHIWQSSSRDLANSRTSTTMLTKKKTSSSEYDAEVAALSSVRHVNVVKLYCSITSEDSNLLVYEYLPNGSLWDQLHSCRKIEMAWQVRYEVAVGAARGLEYLHHGCHRPVIHRDVKSSNILLDMDCKPRIADFGLAKILHASGIGVGDLTHVIAGTLGYIAPEYAYTSKINEKSDVYSFGVVLLELGTGKKPNEPEFGEHNDIVRWAHRRMRDIEGGPKGIVDPSIPEAEVEDAVKVLRIALRCTSKFPSTRPSMRMVVQMLEQAAPYNLVDIVVNKGCESNREGSDLNCNMRGKHQYQGKP